MIISNLLTKSLIFSSFFLPILNNSFIFLIFSLFKSSPYFLSKIENIFSIPSFLANSSFFKPSINSHGSPCKALLMVKPGYLSTFPHLQHQSSTFPFHSLYAPLISSKFWAFPFYFLFYHEEK